MLHHLVVPANAGTHMWTAAVAQEAFLVRSDRLHPYVRPVDAVGLNRWPRWFPRRELQSTTRPDFGQWVPRTVSHLGASDPTISSSCSSDAAGAKAPTDRFLRRRVRQACARCRIPHPSPSAS